MPGRGGGRERKTDKDAIESRSADTMPYKRLSSTTTKDCTLGVYYTCKKESAVLNPDIF